MDTMFTKQKSICSMTAAQIFTNGQGYNQFYPMKGKAKVWQALMAFIHDAGIPEVLISDAMVEELHGEFHHICSKYHIKQEHTIPYHPWQNLAEASI